MQSSLEQQRVSVQHQRELARAVFRPQASFAQSTEPACDPLPEPVVDQLVAESATREGLDPKVIREVARQESAFRPCAVSSKGALGLMQLMPGTAQDLNVSNPFDPKENMQAGSRFLKALLERYEGDLALALSAYNAGPKRVDKAGTVPNIPETQQYVRNIAEKLALD